MTQHTKHSRRRLLKTIAAGGGVIASAKTLPEQWASPVVQTVLTPAHATTTTCSIPAGCYSAVFGDLLSFNWPGGTGPSLINFYAAASCSVSPAGTVLAVAAASAEEAATLLNCPLVDTLRVTSVNGCSLYFCD